MLLNFGFDYVVCFNVIYFDFVKVYGVVLYFLFVEVYVFKFELKFDDGMYLNVKGVDVVVVVFLFVVEVFLKLILVK